MVWCWRLKNLNIYWKCDSCVDSITRGDNRSPLHTITIISIMKRFRSVDLDTPYVDGGQLHVSFTKVEFCYNKSPAPTQCSRLRPNLHLKDSTNKNYGFLVCSIAPQALVQWSENHSLGLYIGSDNTAWICWRHRGRLFLSLFRPFSSHVFWCLYAPQWTKRELILTSRVQIISPRGLKACWLRIFQHNALILLYLRR